MLGGVRRRERTVVFSVPSARNGAMLSDTPENGFSSDFSK